MSTEPRICENCKNPLTPQASFCKKCGKPAPVAPPPPQTEQQRPPQPPQQGKGTQPPPWMKWAKLATLALCVIAVLLLVIALKKGGNGPDTSGGNTSKETPAKVGAGETKVNTTAPGEEATLQEARQALGSRSKIAKHIEPLLQLLRNGSPDSRGKAKALLLQLVHDKALLDRLGSANAATLLAGLESSGDAELSAAAQAVQTARPKTDGKSDAPPASGMGTINIADTAAVVMLDGNVVAGVSAPASIPARSGTHTVKLFRSVNDAVPFRTERLTVKPNEDARISRSN